VREYQFKGEMGATNSLLRLGNRIKQKQLAASTLDQIWSEVDIDHRRALLTSQLEDCVTFLANSSSQGTSLDGETKLETYLLNTLLLSPQRWAEMSCPTLSAQVRLCHLKALLDGLEERRFGGDPLRDLPARFRAAPLEPAHQAALRRAWDRATPEEGQELVDVMREFLLQQFVPAGESGSMYGTTLFNYLQWSEYRPAWFDDEAEGFPQDLEIKYAYECFHFLRTLL
jgi:hypothetical protein